MQLVSVRPVPLLLALSCVSVHPDVACVRSSGDYSQSYCYLVDSDRNALLSEEGGRIFHGDYTASIRQAALLTGDELEAHLKEFPEDRELVGHVQLYRFPRDRELQFIRGQFSRGVKVGLWEWFSADGELLFSITYQDGQPVACTGTPPALTPEWLQERRLTRRCS